MIAARDAKDIEFYYATRDSTEDKPQTNDDFKKLPGLGDVPYSGRTCLQSPNFGDAGLKDGQNITLQIRWKAGPRDYVGYQVRLGFLPMASFHTESYTPMFLPVI